MPLSTDVTLPTKLTPVFPDRCVVCEQETTRRSTISVHSANFLLSMLTPILTLFGWKRIEFALCEECRPRFFFQRWSRDLLMYVIIIAALVFVLPMMGQMPRGTVKLILLGIGILMVVPSALLDLLFPRWFDVTASSNTSDFEFKSADYAMQFCMLNVEQFPDAEIKFEGELIGDQDLE